MSSEMTIFMPEKKNRDDPFPFNQFTVCGVLWFWHEKQGVI